MAVDATTRTSWLPSSYPSIDHIFDLDDALTFPVNYEGPDLRPGVELPTAAEADVNDVVCSICREGFRPGKGDGKQLPCRHMYHSDCISTWLFRCNSCPLCRAQVSLT